MRGTRIAQVLSSSLVDARGGFCESNRTFFIFHSVEPTEANKEREKKGTKDKREKGGERTTTANQSFRVLFLPPPPPNPEEGVGRLKENH